MMKEHKITLPLVDNEILSKFVIGDKVYISGELLVFRDQVHKKIVTGEIEHSVKANFYNSGIYYCAASPAKENFVIGSCGPTSAYRMDEFTEPLLRMGVKIMIGKGYRSDKIVGLCRQYRAVYLITYGGCGALLNKHIKSIELIAFPELGTEAMYKYIVSDFPSIVGIDIHGEVLWRVQPVV